MHFPRCLLPVFLSLAPLAHAQQPSFEELERRVDAAVLQLRITVIADESPVQALDAVRLAVRERNAAAEPLFPNGCRARARLAAEVERLVEHAQRWALYFEEVRQFVIETEEARLDEEIAWLDDLVAAGVPIPRARYEQLVHSFERRMHLSIDAFQAPDVRARLQLALDQLFALAERRMGTLAHVQQIRAILVEDRLAQLFLRLEQRIAAGQATRLDFELFEQRLIERRNLILGVPFDPCS